jgi:DNA-binding transcriptional ArsR family regulator
MTSLSETEDEILKTLSTRPYSFEHIVSNLTRVRKERGAAPGSRTTISRALKTLYEKKFVEYDVQSREWKIGPPLGRWIAAVSLAPTQSSLALSRVTQPLLGEIEKRPEKLIDLLAMMFVNSLSRGGKLPVSEGDLVRQIKAQLNVATEGKLSAIGAIWVDAIGRLIGEYSSLMTGILLYRISSSRFGQVDKAMEAATIREIVEQWLRYVSPDIGRFLASSFADLGNRSVGKESKGH